MIPINYDLSRSDLEFLIDQFIFNRRDRQLLSDRLLDGLTYETLSEKYDLSVSQVKNLVHKNKEIVFRHIDRLPIIVRK